MTSSDPENVPVPQNPAISIVKSLASNADEDGSGDVSLGDTLTYSFTVTNTGNVTLTGVTVADPTATMSGGPIASLAPGAVDSTTFTATYVVTSADVAAGQSVNTATVSGTPPSGPDETASDDETVTVVQAILALSKTSVVTQLTSSFTNSVQVSSTSDGTASDSAADLVVTGSEIVYTITVTNSGTGNAAGVEIIDTLPAGLTVTNPDGATVLGNVVTWSIDNIAAGVSATVSLTVTTN